ncbi:MAG: hypothetical protein AAF563_18290 [Pseudomonadota bacterium]
MLIVSSVKRIIVVLVAVLLAGCGQEILVFDGTRYTPEDSTDGPIPGDPDGDQIILTECSPDPEITFFPTTLTEPTLGLEIRKRCQAFFEVVPHDFANTSSQVYRISWLGQGDEAIITPIFAGTTDNSDATIEFIAGFHFAYWPPGHNAPEAFASMDGLGAAHRITITVPRVSGRVEVRAESFDEGELQNDAVEFEMVKPNNALNLAGLLILVPSGSNRPYVIADVFVTIDSI